MFKGKSSKRTFSESLVNTFFKETLRKFRANHRKSFKEPPSFRVAWRRRSSMGVRTMKNPPRASSVFFKILPQIFHALNNQHNTHSKFWMTHKNNIPAPRLLVFKNRIHGPGRLRLQVELPPEDPRVFPLEKRPQSPPRKPVRRTRQLETRCTSAGTSSQSAFQSRFRIDPPFTHARSYRLSVYFKRVLAT